MNQVGIEKSVIGTKSSTHFDSDQNGDNPNADPPKTVLQQIKIKTHKNDQNAVIKKYYIRSFIQLTNHQEMIQRKESATYGEKGLNDLRSHETSHCDEIYC